jgi:hypothetical protein
MVLIFLRKYAKKKASKCLMTDPDFLGAVSLFPRVVGGNCCIRVVRVRIVIGRVPDKWEQLRI